MFEMANRCGSLLVEENCDGIEVVGSVAFAVCLEKMRGDFLEFVEFPGSEIVFRKGFPWLPSTCLHFHKNNLLFFPRHNVYFSQLFSLGILVVHFKNFEPLLLQILRRYSLALPPDRLVFPAKEGKYGEGHKRSVLQFQPFQQRNNTNEMNLTQWVMLL